MKIYTRTGDDGTTGLYRGPRVGKETPRIEAYGTVDELNAVVGLVRAESLPADVDQLLSDIQSSLFDGGAELATPDPDRNATRLLGASDVAMLEKAIDRYQSLLPPLTTFILPGGCRAAAHLHLARTVCRRGERRVVAWNNVESVASSAESFIVRYLNRLSDLLFVLARYLNLEAGVEDVSWRAS